MTWTSRGPSATAEFLVITVYLHSYCNSLFVVGGLCFGADSFGDRTIRTRNDMILDSDAQNVNTKASLVCQCYKRKQVKPNSKSDNLSAIKRWAALKMICEMETTQTTGPIERSVQRDWRQQSTCSPEFYARLHTNRVVRATEQRQYLTALEMRYDSIRHRKKPRYYLRSKRVHFSIIQASCSGGLLITGRGPCTTVPLRHCLNLPNTDTAF